MPIDTIVYKRMPRHRRATSSSMIKISIANGEIVYDALCTGCVGVVVGRVSCRIEDIRVGGRA